MYPGSIAVTEPDRAAVVLAETGRSQTYAELDDRSARLATLLRDRGLRPGDTVALVLDNDIRWAEIAWACWRSGLYLGALNAHLTAPELVPVLSDAAPRAVVTTTGRRPVLAAAATAAGATDLVWLLVGDGTDAADPCDRADDYRFDDYETALSETARDPHLPEQAGGRLLFSSGTTGRPKPFRVHPQPCHPDEVGVRSAPLMRALGFGDGTGDPVVLLVPGPAYHAGPLGFLQSVHQTGGTVVLMRHFDAQAALAAIERHRVTHSQWVPTMFVRLLRLPAEVREHYDLSSHRVAVHAAAPCPPDVKRAMLDWWGPIVHEYYGASEGHGRTVIGPHEWRDRPGSVGRPVGSALCIRDACGDPLPPGEIGEVWMAQDPPGGSGDTPAGRRWGSSGDLGHVDDAGYLYLTGRVGRTIITGGVNVYPREVEDVLGAHPDVADVAVLGVPDPEYGQRVVAVVEPEERIRAAAGPEQAEHLIAYCRARLARVKCPRRIAFMETLPRSAAGKVLVAAVAEHLGRERV